MNISKLSIDRPVFMTCVLFASLVLGIFSFFKLPMDLFPDVTFPVVTVTIPYPGAGPKEVETLIAKPVEEQLSAISGVKNLRSINREGVSIVIIEFTLETDIKDAEQQVRDKLTMAKKTLPSDILEPTLKRIDPSDQPVIVLSLKSDMNTAKLYDLANEVIKPQLEQVPKIGLIEIFGGRKKEIKIELDRQKLQKANLSVSQINDRLAYSGMNIPAGSVATEQSDTKDIVFRTVGEFSSIQDIGSTPVSFWGNDVSLTINQLGTVSESLVDAKNYAFVNGDAGLLLYVYKQSGVNTIEVAANIKKAVEGITKSFTTQDELKSTEIHVEIDRSREIKLNVMDVYESILIGIVLTIIVVFFFLGSLRSTIITGIAIPVSLIGTFTLMSQFGFSINVMSLLAFSLAVGLLIDDAIVVRENIFRHIEMGKSPKAAALEGTNEVMLAVIAVTFTILAVFFPIGFLSGIIGRFFQSFGFTVCFIMLFSLFDALTNAPMLSAYFAGDMHHDQKGWLSIPLQIFEKFQTFLNNVYMSVLAWCIKRPFVTVVITLLLAATSFYFLQKVPKTFLPTQDNGEFAVSLEAEPSISLESMKSYSMEVDKVIRANSAITSSILVVGNSQGEKNKSEFIVHLKPFSDRSKTTSQVKEEIRAALKKFEHLSPKVKDIDIVGGGLRPFTLNIVGQDLEKLQEFSQALFAKLAKHPSLEDVDQSVRAGKEEFQIVIDRQKAAELGVMSSVVGRELRAQLEGVTPNVYRENGLEYDIRLRLRPEQRDLEKNFKQTMVPNMNGRLVSLSAFAEGKHTTGFASIDRENRGRFVQISADVAPNGPGMGGAINEVTRILKEELPLPPGMSYRYVGQADNFQELVSSMLRAALLGVIFIFLILSSLYESFFIPLFIMMVIPLAASGAFFALWITGSQLDLFSMIGCIMLMGLAVKNSIIYVDYMKQLMKNGFPLVEAIMEAGKTRLRPILMTSIALIAGMIPVAIGLNEVSNQRKGLGIAVIGGVISSTLLTLVLIPSVFILIDKIKRKLSRS